MRNRRGAQPRTKRIASRLIIIALLAPLTVILAATAGSAGHQPINVSVVTRTLDVGDTTRVILNNPAGANAIAVGACGNADSAGVALAASAEFDPANCFGFDDLTIVTNGETGSGLMFRLGVLDGGSYSLDYEWSEPIGSNATTCVAGGNYFCRIDVSTFDLTTFSLIDSFTFPIVPNHSFLSLTGPVDAVYDGTVLGFTAAGLGVTGPPIAAVGICGNADVDGVPLPLIALVGPTSCADPFSSPALQPGDGNIIVGGAFVESPFDPFATYSGTIEWVDPSASFFGAEFTCIENGNFPCVVIAGGGSIETLTIVEVQPGPRPRIAVGSADAAEGDNGTQTVSVPVTLDQAITAPVTVDWATVDGTTNAGTDFAADSGTLTFAPGETTAVIDIDILGDTTDEFDEIFGVRITNPHNGVIGGFYGLGFVTILDDDDAPSAIPEFIDFAEGNSGTVIANVPVSLSAPSGKPITVDWQTVSNTATAGVDFVAATGQIGFAPGQTTASIPIEIIGDITAEGDELAVVATTNWVNATPGGYFGLGGVNILEDEGLACADLLLPGANLRGCDLRGEVIENLDLSQADLTGADLTDAQFIDVDMAGATLDGADFTNAIVAGSILDGVSAAATIFDGSTVVNTRMVGLSAPGASIDNATFVGGSARAADLSGSSIQSTVFLVADLRFAGLEGITWGPSTLCPDSTISGEHGNTCRLVPMQLRAQGSSHNSNPVLLTDSRFFATFHPAFPFDPTDLSASSRFGGTSSGIDADLSFVFDSDGDGELDHTYGYLVAGAPLTTGTFTYCAHALFASGDAVYGCDSLTVGDGGSDDDTASTTTTGPPISPPASPPASPPISGAGGALELLPLLAGPLGLMATASGLGLIFLVGANRATSVLEGERRKDDEDEQ